MKNNFELLQSSGLDIFITNQSSRYSPSVMWGNNELEHFLSVAKKLKIDLLYAYLNESEDGDPVLQELGFHHNEMFHYFSPLEENFITSSGEYLEDEQDEESPKAEEERDLADFLAMDPNKLVQDITELFKDSKVSKFQSVKEVLAPFWKNLGIEYGFHYYEDEILKKLDLINLRVICNFNKETVLFQQKLQQSDDFMSTAIASFQGGKFKTIKKMHISEYLITQEIFLNLSPLTLDSLLNRINDGLKTARMG